MEGSDYKATAQEASLMIDVVGRIGGTHRQLTYYVHSLGVRGVTWTRTEARVGHGM